MRIPGILPFLSLLPFIYAATISGNIAFNSLLPLHSLPPTSQISLDYGLTKVWVKQDGSFTFYNVPEGAHQLEPLIPGYIFHPLLVTVKPTVSSQSNSARGSAEDQLHVQILNPARQPLPVSSVSLPYLLVLEPVAKENYFIPKSGLNMLGLLKSPMVLMMLFSGIMMWGMPKLLANMDDPELSKEMAETRQKMQGFQNGDWTGALSNMLAGTAEDKSAPVQSGGGSAKAGGKKRRK
ncbi:hypothetical protein C343_06961 [Cryptococcus neoformans C23]|uniref:ER membrane protein complex subunit 7 beta-sandwich domain-containing protein n=1 Tax=Cryptococcus neoformans (strain H99 / ATCC 208821 / CBS 10515 / FGSC 9487) TaxID=235443 RepID=J9VXJ6_CRYN9|nr:hypothetical protein CNAG_05546 [Cryptococcus neoformans var. grubii H99]AFR98973.1 hypothetical protein CNAG_05546 [Cryptococcus neoformans var. grubii H99]AUB29199.1 hypothetical protein CKF44_05546 [Cryptococcus neoformans var. grubii]OWZ37948.1 hypothetical protein C343_06961 [Cryptococcus neoformans var. grubii C23]|eukprot:XP_012053840.1 hypothetical protein CNAG_05546 [Cryptococcus neoformans var. grubii H99]